MDKGWAFAARKVQNVVNIAVVTAFVAQIAILPPKWQADVRERGAELTFWVGGKLGQCHRNNTNAADRSANAAAMKFVHVAAVVARHKFKVAS